MSEIKMYQYKDLLNRLSEMQRVPYYATAYHDLVKAEMAIVALENERDDLRAALADRDAKIDQLRVQLAGCGVAAMQNTEASKAERVKRGDYGWSESYGDVCRAVDREIDLRAKLAALEKNAVTDDMKMAVRWAPSSAYWSTVLVELFGPDARSGINALEKQLREQIAAAAAAGTAPTVRNKYCN